MANLMVYPRFKAFDSDGTALASGKVYTYIAGTTTNKATYTDAAAGTPNANPVVLDSNGEADIWLLTDEEYKFKITDSADTTIATVDNISPIGNISTLEANLDTNSYSIVSSGGNDITIEPASGQNIILDGLTWPSSDGTANQVLSTNGSNTLSFSSAGTDVVGDTTPQLGGDLDANSYDIQFDDGTGIKDESGNEQILFSTTSSAVNYINITNSATGAGPTIAAAGSDTSVDLRLDPQVAGKVVLDGIKWPSSDGSANQILQTDGNGVLSFATQGKRVQKVVATSTTVTTLSTQIPLDDTIPQNTQGDEVITLAITPTSSSNKLLIRAYVPFCGISAAGTLSMALFQDSTANALQAMAQNYDDNYDGPLELAHYMTAGTTSATTFKIRIGPGSAITGYTLGDDSGVRKFGGIAQTVLEIEEYEV